VRQEKKLHICGFHLYGCLAAARLQQTHNVYEKTETSSSYNQAFSVRTKSSTRKQEKCFLVQNKISAEKRNYNYEQNKFLKEIS